jgi:hypothetical protein
MIREKKEIKTSKKEASAPKPAAKNGKIGRRSVSLGGTELSKSLSIVGADRSDLLGASTHQALLQPGYLCVPLVDMAVLTPLAESCDLSLVSIESIWDGQSLGFNSHGMALSPLPARLIGFVSVSDAGTSQIEALREAWPRLLNVAVPDAAVVKTPVDFSDIYLWLVRKLVKAQAEMAVRNTSLMRSLSVIRAEHEAVQESFQRLESFAYASALVTRQIALSLDPKKNELLRISSGLTAEIRQLIPVSSLGLCDLAIHVVQVPTLSDGKLEITLKTLEDGGVVGTWSLATSQIREGWLRLGLEQALSVDERSVAVSILWSGPGEIALSLSDPHPEPRWCAYQGKKSASGPLSMKVWRSLPGTRAVPAVQAQLNASIESRVQMLYADDLRKVEGAGASQEGILFDETGNSLLVHPVVGAVTWARLPQVIPEGTMQIFADIETKNDKAGPVEYAIAVAPSAGKSRKGTTLQFKPDCISEWIRVDAVTQSQVHLYLDPSLQGEHDLYLGTRLQPGNSNAFCWAHFRKIRLSH